MKLTDFSKAFSLFTVFAVFFSGCGKDEDATPQVSKVDIVSMTPPSPASLKYYETDPNDRVQITFDYTITEPDGARIYIIPVASAGGQGSLKYSPSGVYKGSGSKTVLISAESNQPSVLVDQIKILIKSHDQTEIISETFVDVSYTFSSTVNTFTLDGETFALANGFAFRGEESDGVYPWLIALTSEGINYDDDEGDFVGTGEIIFIEIFADANYAWLPSGSYSLGGGNADCYGVGVNVDFSTKVDLDKELDDISLTISLPLTEIEHTIKFTIKLTDGRVVTGSYKGIIEEIKN
jgi:hypothetical protein